MKGSTSEGEKHELSPRYKYISHICGALIDGVQRCVLCGEIISDYRGAMVEAGSGPLKGFEEGKTICISELKNPQIFTSTEYMGENDYAIECSQPSK